MKDVSKYASQFKRKYPESKYLGSIEEIVKKSQEEILAHQKVKKEYEEEVARAKAEEEAAKSENLSKDK